MTLATAPRKAARRMSSEDSLALWREYRRTNDRALRDRLARGEGLWAYLDGVARIGVTVCDRSDAGFNLGYAGTVGYWVLELVVVVELDVEAYGAAAPDTLVVSARRADSGIPLLADTIATGDRTKAVRAARITLPLMP